MPHSQTNTGIMICSPSSSRKAGGATPRWAADTLRWAATLPKWAAVTPRWAATLPRWAATLLKWAADTLPRWAADTLKWAAATLKVPAAFPKEAGAMLTGTSEALVCLKRKRCCGWFDQGAHAKVVSS